MTGSPNVDCAARPGSPAPVGDRSTPPACVKAGFPAIIGCIRPAQKDTLTMNSDYIDLDTDFVNVTVEKELEAGR